jgi:hypothetical protein
MERDMASYMHDKMGFKRRTRRRPGSESKRAADAIHAITAARTNDASDQAGPKTSTTGLKIEDNSDSSESGDYDSATEVENDEGIFYDNEETYVPVEEEIVNEDVYIDEIDETEYEDEAEYENETEHEDETEYEDEEEDESEESETEYNDETEFDFKEQEEMGAGSISIDETETEAGLDVVEVISTKKVTRLDIEEIEETENEIDEVVVKHVAKYESETEAQEKRYESEMKLKKKKKEYKIGPSVSAKTNACLQLDDNIFPKSI